MGALSYSVALLAYAIIMPFAMFKLESHFPIVWLGGTVLLIFIALIFNPNKGVPHAHSQARRRENRPKGLRGIRKFRRRFGTSHY